MVLCGRQPLVHKLEPQGVEGEKKGGLLRTPHNRPHTRDKIHDPRLDARIAARARAEAGVIRRGGEIYCPSSAPAFLTRFTHTEARSRIKLYRGAEIIESGPLCRDGGRGRTPREEAVLGEDRDGVDEEHRDCFPLALRRRVKGGEAGVKGIYFGRSFRGRASWRFGGAVWVDGELSFW